MTQNWNIAQALSSVRRLDEMLVQLKDEEISQLIKLEEEVARRKTFLDKLYREARQRARKQFIR